MQKLKTYQLFNLFGKPITSPRGKQALICFIKEDCPTCKEITPLLDALHKSLSSNIVMHVIGQDFSVNQNLNDLHKPAFSILDDSDLLVSYALDIEIVPTIIAVCEDGFILEKLAGFVRDDWKQLIKRINKNPTKDVIDWHDFPEWRPGCGSLSADPINSSPLRAISEAGRISARKIELGSADDAFEYMYDQGII